MRHGLERDGQRFRDQGDLQKEQILQDAYDYYRDEDRTVSFEEKRTWYLDMNKLMASYYQSQDVYLVLQYLERKAHISAPTVDKVISRRLIETEYDLLGYTVLKLINDDGGSLKYGAFQLNLFKGPVFVEELLNDYRNINQQLKVSLSYPN